MAFGSVNTNPTGYRYIIIFVSTSIYQRATVFCSLIIQALLNHKIGIDNNKQKDTQCSCGNEIKATVIIPPKE